METSNTVAICCLIIAIPQGAIAIHQLLQITSQSRSGEASMSYKVPSMASSLLLLAGGIATIFFAAWMFWAKPLRPTVVEKTNTVTVEKPVSCPPSQTGPATSKGNNSPAHSGNGDTFTNTPAPTKSPH